MTPLLLLLLAAHALAIPLGQAPSTIEFDEAFPEEVPGFFEGDIELLPGEKPYERNAIRNRNLRWHNGVVPFVIDSHFSSSEKAIIQSAMDEIHTKTKVNGRSCITFTPRHSESQYAKFQGGTGCHSPVGLHSGMSGVSLGRGCIRKGTIMHEILHVLGFWHEQSRPDRDSYVTVHWENIQSSHSFNFNKMTTSQVDTLGEPYDYGSVMHYGAYSFAIDRRKPTIEPKQRGAVIGQRVRLSDIDVEKIQILYGCKSGLSVTASPHATAATAAPVVTTPQPASRDTCTFSSDFCHWTNVHGTDNVDWSRHRGGTPSSSTGPHADHYGSSTGYYAYIEASGHYNAKAVLKSKEFTEGSYCVSIYYNMYGRDMGSLNIYLVANGQRRLAHTMSGDHGDRWIHYLMNMRVTHATFHLELEGMTGRSYHSDIAIDDLSVTSGSCTVSGKRDVEDVVF